MARLDSFVSALFETGFFIYVLPLLLCRRLNEALLPTAKTRAKVSFQHLKYSVRLGNSSPSN